MIQDIVENSLPNRENYLVGYADMGELMPARFAPMRYAVVLARRLDRDIAESISAGPNKTYSGHYHAINAELETTLNALAERLKQEGIQSIALTPTSREQELDQENMKQLRSSFSHKMAATRAGLGWIGKTALLITREYGPRVRLGSLLTDHPLPDIGVPITQNYCGTCNACVEACPAVAANGTAWQAGMERGEFYDAFKCRKKCRELSMKNMGEEISLCGICIAACPVGKNANDAE